MHKRAKTAIAAIGITALGVVGLDTYTYAGTGDSVILGKLNKAGKTTHVTNTGNGPALSLHAKGKHPALAVDSKAKIVRLNADRVDGRDATALQNNVRVYTATSGNAADGQLRFDIPNLPKGKYVANYNVYMLGLSGTVANPTTAECWLMKANAAQFAATETATSVGGGAGVSGSGVITEDGVGWQLHCRAHQSGAGLDSWEIDPLEPIRVTLMRIHKTIGGPLATTRTGPNLRMPARAGH